MNTFYQLWGTKTPFEAKQIIDSQRINFSNPMNLEQQALSIVGTDVYNKLIKGYTEKQWGKPATEIPAFIIQCTCKVPL
jgi:UDP-galactopyranose mutase